MTQKCHKIRKLLCLGCLVLLSSSTSLPTWTTRKVAPVGSLLALSLKFHFPLFFRLLSSSLCPLLMLSAHFEIFNFQRLDLICHSCEIKEKKEKRKEKEKDLGTQLCSLAQRRPLVLTLTVFRNTL